MKKRILTLALALTMVLALLPAAAPPVEVAAATVKSVVNGRDDGVWLWPTLKAQKISDWAGCSNNSYRGDTSKSGNCVLCGVNHDKTSGQTTWNDNAHRKTDKNSVYYKYGHAGIDISGTKLDVYAAADGIVRDAHTSDSSGRGKYVIIEHENPSDSKTSYYSIYQHLDSISVKKGATVKAGAVIAKSGKTDGTSDGGAYHLHFGITLGPRGYTTTVNTMEGGGWFVKSGTTAQAGRSYGRIVTNPSTTTSGVNNRASALYHSGSVTYTFDVNKVSIGPAAVPTPIPSPTPIEFTPEQILEEEREESEEQEPELEPEPDELMPDPDPIIVVPNNGIALEAVVTELGVKLNWAPSGNALGYRIFRGRYESDEGISITDFPLATKEYVDVNVESDTAYWYAIAAVEAEASFNTTTMELTPERLGPRSAAIEAATEEIITDDETDGVKKHFILMKINDPQMLVDEEYQEIDPPGRGTTPILRSERTMVPIRAIIEAMDGEVGWDAGSRTVSLDAGEYSVSMQIGNKGITANGEAKEMDVAPEIINERTMLPLRFVAENMGCEIAWIGATREIIIVFYTLSEAEA
jgi:murein DD-endopeptidase MepM/ murein hydrolase activator NlpD